MAVIISGINPETECIGCQSCVFHWDGDSRTVCIAQSHPNNPAGKRLHTINYDEDGNNYHNPNIDCYTWKESTCPLKIENAIYKNRKEQREVLETMNALLSPMIERLNDETAVRVRRALYILSKVDIKDD